MYPYVVNEGVLLFDIPGLRSFFRTPETWDQVMANLDATIKAVCVNPAMGKRLDPPLYSWRRVAWASGPVPTWSPRPDMRLIYRLDGDRIVILIIGRRAPGDSNDVYRVAAQRQRL